MGQSGSGQSVQSSHVPYEEGFVPSAGPIRPPWTVSSSNSTFKFQQREFHKQDHKLKFPPPTVNSNGPFDHRGSLPIRDDPTTMTPSSTAPTLPPKPVLTQKGVLPLVFAEEKDEPPKMVYQTSMSPARTTPTTTPTTEPSTTPDFSKIFPQDDDYHSGPSYPSGSDYPSSSGNNYTFSSKFNSENSSTLGGQSNNKNQIYSPNNPTPSYKDRTSDMPKKPQNFSFTEQVMSF
jgi:hypothetical protein